MIFQSIKLSNYGLYAGTQVIKPVVGTKGNPNITLIGGMNGRGKTSLLEAVLLVLYGNRSPSVRQQSQSYSSYLESLIHKGIPHSEGSFVELEVSLPGNSETTILRIRRSWRTTNVRCTDRLEIWQSAIGHDGRRLPEVKDTHLADNWTSHVEELLPSGLAGLFFFDGEKIAQIAEADETDESLRQSIRAILGLDLVDRLIGDMGAVIRRNQATVRNAAVREQIRQFQEQRAQLAVLRQQKLQEKASLQGQIEKKQALHDDLQKAFYEEGGRFVESRDALHARELTLSAELGACKAAAIQMAADSLPLLLAESLLMQIRNTTKHETHVIEARSAVQLLSERDNRLLEHISALPQHAGLVSTVRHWLTEDLAELKRVATEPVVFALSSTGFDQLNQLAGQSTDLREAARHLKAQAEHLTREIDQVRSHLEINVDDAKIQDLIDKIADATRAVSHLKVQRDMVERDCLEIERKIAEIDRTQSQYAANLGEIEEADRIIRYAGRTQETMRVFRERATKEKVGALTRQIALAFDELTSKTTLAHEVRMDPESLRISLHDAQGQEIPKARLSSGEKQMLAIAILWGLARASGRTLPVIIDTPMGRLDSSHRMHFVTKYLPNASHQVMVLSTDTEIVGPYLEKLNGSIGKLYLLNYDEELRRTNVLEGYFNLSGSNAQ